MSEKAKGKNMNEPTEGTFNPEGLCFSDGDNPTGYWYTEEGVKWYHATDSEGRLYETKEAPRERATATH